jgi:phosphohistidine phosphatase
MIIGHNPGLEELVLELVTDGDPDVLGRVREKFPTGALATLLLPGEWDAAGDGGMISDLTVPRDLE